MGGGVDLGYGNTADYEWRVQPGAFEASVENYYPGIAAMFAAKLGRSDKSPATVKAAAGD